MRDRSRQDGRTTRGDGRRLASDHPGAPMAPYNLPAVLFGGASNSSDSLQRARRRLSALGRTLHPIVVASTLSRAFRRSRHSVVGPSGATGQLDHALYQLWLRRYGRPPRHERERIRAAVEDLEAPPIVSVVMPLGRAKPSAIHASIESVRRQLYSHWELWLLGETSSSAAEVSTYCDQDSRIRALPHRPLHLAEAADLVGGDWLTFLYPLDRFSEVALWELVQAATNRPEAALIYSDEDRIDEIGRRFDPHFKPDWNLDLAQSCGYTGRLTAVVPGILRAAGRIRVSGDGSHEVHLSLSASRAGNSATVAHISKILYHTGQSDRPLCATSRRALESFFDGSKRRPEILDGPWSGAFRLRWPLPPTPPVITLIVATRNAAPLLEKLIRTLRERTSYPAYRLLLLDHRSDEPAARAHLDRLQQEPGVKVLRYEAPFNFSAMNNLGVANCQTELVGFLNNDLEILEEGWLDEMVSHALRPGVGAVGAKLLYPDGTVQHGGILLGGGAPNEPVAGHLFHSLRRDAPGYFGRALVAQSVSAVTAACLVMQRAIFKEIGGFDENNLAVAFNDVDLCLRLGEAGYRVVWTPHAQLLHHESTTREHDLRPRQRERFAAEVRYMRRRWGSRLDHDPYYNLNLDPVACDYSLAFPPRPDAASTQPVAARNHASGARRS